MTYDATLTFIQAITTQLEKFQPVTRVNIQQTIANPDFSTQGAIGTIRFTPNGNRRNPFVELVKVAKCHQQMHFLPLQIQECASNK